ncbi:hypothetical protein [Streptomyces sp. Ru71]|nr:hypothetical protein [Streptomyces sp. Ru71]
MSHHDGWLVVLVILIAFMNVAYRLYVITQQSAVMTSWVSSA